ncbi:uncharacterized protein TRIADDRAFT_53589 [Trichoplax adhaerens]|uniref:Methionine aminopeptidase n=1 Tax=Trichoplax adhaerens TaxID=10228 RepID=B3RPM1_TRIAD|nr:hypothetical protein TRIADDRAFT_53589 [Trichoplax adhaerens]EDV28214.1 hypothetical protein TRIADDRAFT_53589 [Trichoplax adhaerens]|eukprot:XP_002110048.1 hypothetical protein TRIADDRAFT_53589 [Trichoplax adhaerens]
MVLQGINRLTTCCRMLKMAGKLRIGNYYSPSMLFSSRYRQIFRSWSSFSLVQPKQVSPAQPVPQGIPLPPYALTGVVPPSPITIEIKNEDQIDAMKRSCQLAYRILDSVKNYIKVGMTTEDIDQFVHDNIIQHGAYPSPLNYNGYPKSVCTSVNNVACHGIPDSRPLEDGDIINVDISVYYNGYHGDTSDTFLLGNVDETGQQLVETAKLCLQQAIDICGPNVPFRNIGKTISNLARAAGFTVNKMFLGHGIGSYFHGPPHIYHYRNWQMGHMRPGMTFTIEPVICEGTPDAEILEDGWTAISTDNKRSAQCEHTVLITSQGVEILTRP